jgi:hypothetical protein
MNNEFLITICTMLIGFLGVIFTVISLNNSLRSEIKAEINNLRTEYKEELKKLEERFESRFQRVEDDIKELRSLIMGLYSPRLVERTEKKDVA